MSGVEYYAHLLDNRTRVEAFQRAVGRTVRPGDRVLDLGTGVGTYAFFAARAGAARVWAVDRDPAIHVAESLAVANGLADRIEFVRGEAPGVSLGEKVDVLIFEDFPVPLMDRATFHLLDHVRRSMLAPEGRMIPVSARLNLAPVRSEAVWHALLPLADGDPDRRFGLDWSCLRPFLANTPRQLDLRREDLAGVPVRGDALPLMPPPRAEALHIAGSWDADTGGRVHALALWFDLEVSPDDWISNEPRSDPEPWRQWVLPVDPPLDVPAGTSLDARLGPESLEEGAPGWWAWEVRAGSVERRGHEMAGLPAGRPDLTPSDEADASPRGPTPPTPPGSG